MVAKAAIAGLLCAGAAALRQSLHGVAPIVPKTPAEPQAHCKNTGLPEVEMLTQQRGDLCYVGPVYIGKSEVLATYDSAFTGLAIFDASCTMCGDGHYYDHTLSDTFQKIEEGLTMPFEDGECTYTRGYEFVKENRALDATFGEDPHMEIMVITSCQGVHFRQSSDYSAIVGLSFAPKDKSGHDTSFPMHMGYCRFTICMDRSYKGNAKLVWEDIDREGTKGTFKIPLISDKAWAFEVHNLRFTSHLEGIPSWTSGCTGKLGCIVIVDTSFQFIALPDGVLKTSMEMFQHPRFTGCDDSSVFPSMDFDVNNTEQYTKFHAKFNDKATMSLPGYSYVARVIDAHEPLVKQKMFANTILGGQCQMLFLSTKGLKIEGRQVIILGQPALKEYSMQFNVMPSGADQKPSMLAWHAGDNCEPDLVGGWVPVKHWQKDPPKSSHLKNQEVDITVSEVMGKTVKVSASRVPEMEHVKVPLREINEADLRLPRWWNYGLNVTSWPGVAH